MKFTTTFYVSLILFGVMVTTVTNLYPQRNDSHEIQQAALESLEILKALPQTVLKELGFKSKWMIERSSLGIPMRTYIVWPGSIKKFKKNDDPRKILVDVKEINYPVYVDVTPITSVTIRKRKGQWRFAIIGDKETLFAEYARRIHSSSGSMPLSSYFIVKIPPLYLTFLAYISVGKLYLIPTHEDPDLEFPLYEPVLAKDVFLELKRLSSGPGRSNRLSLSIGLKSAWSYWGLEDFALSKNNFEDLYPLEGTLSTKDLNGSFSGAGEFSVEYKLANYHSIGLSTGFQYFPGGRFEQTWSSDTDLFAFGTKMELSTSVVPIDLFYKRRVGRKSFFKLAVGTDFYNAIIDYDYSENNLGMEFFNRGKLKDAGIGGHISIEAGYFLAKKLALTLEAGYSLCKLNNFTGALVDQDGLSSEMLLTMAYDILSHMPVQGPFPPGAGPAEVNFSGFKFSLGLKFLFQKEGDR